jgi:hypothetical protein
LQEPEEYGTWTFFGNILQSTAVLKTKSTCRLVARTQDAIWITSKLEKEMPIYEMTKGAIREVPKTTLAEHGFRERDDLQRVLRQNISAVAPDAYVLCDEYGEWDGAKRRIDLLCIDKDANIVVIELKRNEDGGHMDLQSIRYASMVSKMTFKQAVEAHAKYLSKTQEDAEAAILEFLAWEEPHEKEFGKDTRIILVSGEFSKEVTTSAYWLNEHDVDVRCVRLRPYSIGDRVLLDIQQVLPVPEVQEILIKIKNKTAEERKSEGGSRTDWTQYDLAVDGKVFRNLTKRKLFLLAIHGLISRNVPFSEIRQSFPARKFIDVAGHCDPEEFRKKVSDLRNRNGTTYDLGRFFTGPGELFVADGRTYALTNQWGRSRLPALDALISKYPDAKVSYAPTTSEED